MKKVLLCIVVLLIICNCASARGNKVDIENRSEKRTDISAIKNELRQEFNQKAEEIQQGMLNAKLEMSSKIDKVETNLNLKFSANLQAEINGLNQSMNANAGRDSIITDPKIVYGLIGYCIFLTTMFFSLLREVIGTKKSKKFYKDRCVELDKEVVTYALDKEPGEKGRKT